MARLPKILVSAAIAAWLAGTAFAAPPESPSIKPSKDTPAAPSAPTLRGSLPAPSGTATTPAPGTPSTAPKAAPLPANAAQVAYLRRAITASNTSQWSDLASLQYGAADPAVKNLVMWLRASEGVPGMSFDELDLALTADGQDAPAGRRDH
jgi:soluble lytic murein transglycosylase